MLNKSRIKSIRNYFLLSFIALWFSFCNIKTPFSGKESSNDNNLLLGVALYTVFANSGNCETGGDLWARNIQTQSSYCVPVELVASNTKVDVYKERGLSVNYDLQTFGKEFNDTTYPKLVSTFGEPSDVDKSGKIKILVLDIRDGATANSSYVAGFFDPVNYFADQPGTSLRSNYAEVLYMDGKELIDALVSDPTAFSSTAAHEFQHLIRYPYMVATRATDDSWINEGTSEVASDIAGYGPQKYRINCFRGADSTRCPNGVNGVSFLNWSTQSTTSSVILKQYAFAYAFMRYLYDISGNTEAEKNEFFRKSVQGNSIGIRAGSASQLMSVFRESSRFNSTLLGTLGSDTFFRTFILFMGQSAGTLNFTSVERFDANTNLETLDLSAAYTAYPFESTLNDIVAGPLGVNTATGTLSFSQGSGYAFTGNYSLSGYGSTKYPNMTTVKSAGNSKSVLAWAAYSTSVSTSVKNGSATSTKSEEANNRYKSIILGDTTTEGALPVCGTQFINDEPHIYESIPLEQPSSKSGNTP